MESSSELDDKRITVKDLVHDGLVLFRTKGRCPVEADWKTRTVAVPPRAFGQGDNVGALLGPKSGIVEVSIDEERALDLAPWFLPHTDFIYGRETHRRRGQYLYRTANAGRTRVFRSPGIPRLVTVRSSGSLALLPLSRVSGETIDFYSDGSPGEHEYGAIVQASAELAIATLLRPFWIPDRASRLARA